MTRFITQLLVGLMLFFGTATLLPKSIVMFRSGRLWKGLLYMTLAGTALFFSCMAFYYAYLLMQGGLH